MFNSILDGNNLSISSSLICMFSALLLGGIVALIHGKKSSKDFLITLVTLPLIVQVVIIMVNGNLGTSVAILGAFSLIRFRSLQCNSKELLVIFLTMAIGLATGMGYIIFAFVFTIVACLTIFILDKLFSGKAIKQLKIVVPEDLDYEEIFDDIFEKYTNSVKMIKTKTINMGSLYELTYDVDLKGNVKSKDFIDELRVKNGNLKISLTHSLESSEL